MFRGRGGRGRGRGGWRGRGGGGVFSRQRKTFSPEKTRHCGVCKDADHKYRCPRCSILYCSLKCFKDHKSKCLDDDLDIEDEFDDWGADGVAVGKSGAAAAASFDPALTHLAAYHQRLAIKKGEATAEGEIELYSSSSSEDEDEDENPDRNPDRLKKKDLRTLTTSDKLKELLANPHLRNLVLEVDQAEDKNAVMQAAMQEPLFLELADACLEVVDKDKR